MAPLTTILPESTAVLDDLQAVVAIEAKRMLADQRDGKRMSAGDAKALGAMTHAFIEAEKAQRELANAGLGELSAVELEQALVAELEALRARGKGSE